MRRRRRSSELLRDDGGSASLEFIVGGILLLVPIVYLVVTLGVVQSHALGVEAASRHVARAVGASDGAADADRRAGAVLSAIAAEYGIDPGEIDVDVSCVGATGTCPAAGATVRVKVTSSVALPLVPAVLGLDDATRIGLESSSVQKVSRYWRDG